MPVEFVELAKLIGGVILLTVPGYLWSFFFLENITRLERIIFGFILSISMFIIAFFSLDLVLKIPITQTKTLIFYAIYTTVIIILVLASIIKKGIPDRTKRFFITIKTFITHPKQTIKEHKNIQILLLLIGVLIFSAFMGFLPHLKDAYYLPFHVDEWIDWTYTKSFMESGSTAFINPYLGTGITQSLEPGFNYFIATLAWLTGVNFNTMFIFMPAMITLLASLTAFNLGNRYKRRFGLEAALCIAVIPTTSRMMGPSFFVPVTLGLFYLVFLLWLLQQKKSLMLTVLVPICLWVIFLIHPPTALAGMIITFIYALMLLLDKEFKETALHILFALLPVGGALFLTTRWGASISQVIDAFFGGKYLLDYNLPPIWVSFEQMGIVIWVFSVIGIYFAFSKGKTLIRTIGLSALAFIIVIGLYDKIGYGPPVMYERSFMYLFLMIGLLAGWGLAELRRSIAELAPESIRLRAGTVKINAVLQKTCIIIPIIVFIIIAVTTVPAHVDTPYYHMITETDYDAFSWINEHIDNYRDSSHPYDRGAVDPFKASPFSAITRLSIVSSTMHPIPGYEYHQRVSSFLSGCCKDESFLKEFDVSVVYTTGCCTNSNLTTIHPGIYLYPGLFD